MATNATITVLARKKMVRARAGEPVNLKIAGMAFGNGGSDDSGSVIPVSDAQTGLNHEILRKPVDGHEFRDETTCRYFCTLENEELVGESISEIALYDEDGDIVAIKNFRPKGKDDDLEMTFNVDDMF